jgi:hypothetical protein
MLAGCTAGAARLLPVNPLVHPPWEAFVRAGPGADKDVDYETLNGPSIATAQPGDVKLDQDIEVADLPAEKSKAKPADKNAEVIKSVAVLGVKGAGSGNDELTQAMRAVLDDAGWPVLEAKRKDALNIQGKVSLSPVEGNSQTVRIVWLVTSPSGKGLGDVRQENAVPAGSLDNGWGDNAVAAAQAAAEGISKLIEKYR